MAKIFITCYAHQSDRLCAALELQLSITQQNENRPFKDIRLKDGISCLHLYCATCCHGEIAYRKSRQEVKKYFRCVLRLKNSSLPNENQHRVIQPSRHHMTTYSKGRATHYYMLDLSTCLPHFHSNTGFLE
jgi:hypothetical protein